MNKKVAIIFAFVGFFFGAYGLTVFASSCTPFFTFQGGTGSCGLQAGKILFGNGTSAVATSTALTFSSTGNTLLTVTNASSTNLSATAFCLTGDTCRTTWPASVSIGGSDTQVQFNDSGSLGGNAAFIFTKTGTTKLTITNASSTNLTSSSYFAMTGTATSTFGGAITVAAGQGTSTFAGGVSATVGNFTSTTATTTHSNGITLGGGTLVITNAGSGAAIFTSGVLSAATLSVANGGTGAVTLTGCLTGNGTSAITGSGTCNTSNATVSSIATNNGLTGGTITTTGTIGLASIAANSVLGTIGASAVPVAFATSSLFTFSPAFSAGATTLANVVEKSFTYATSTTWTGTTTIPLEQVINAKTLNGTRCWTDVGTVNVLFGIGSASTTMITASTTNNYNAFTTNTSLAAGNHFMVAIGTPASSPTTLNCTNQLTI